MESVRDAEPQKLLRRYFQPLGMHRRVWSVVNLARVFLEDPPVPVVLGCKVGEFDSHSSEIAHLPGVGEYASDAWRLFCRKDFYAANGMRVAEQWPSLRPNDRILLCSVQRKRREAASPPPPVTPPGDTLASQLEALQISHDPPTPLEGGLTVGTGESKLFVSCRVLRLAKSMRDPEP